MSQTEAEEAAVREMGDPVEVGLEMDRIHRPTMAWGMIALIVGLSLAGYLLRSVMYQTVLGIEQSAGKQKNCSGQECHRAGIRRWNCRHF